MAKVSANGSLTIIRGDSIRIPFQYLEDDGTTPIDLTGSTIASQVRTKPGGFVMLELQVEYVDRANGQVLLKADKEVTRLLRKEEGFWDIEHESAGGLVTTILGPAPVLIVKDITVEAEQ